MNSLPSWCNNCGKDIMVNQAEWNNSAAHQCLMCDDPSVTVTSYDDSEFDLDTEEELDFCNGPDWLDEYDEMLDDICPVVKRIERCECGAEKTGSPFHSRWCPKHG